MLGLTVAAAALSCGGGEKGLHEEIAGTVKGFAVAFANGEVDKLDGTFWSKSCSVDEVTKADATASAIARSLDGAYKLTIESDRLAIVVVDKDHVQVPLDQAEGVFKSTVNGGAQDTGGQDVGLVLIGDAIRLVWEDGSWRVECPRFSLSGHGVVGADGRARTG